MARVVGIDPHRRRGPILIDPIISAELAPVFATNAPAIFVRFALPCAAGWRAEAFCAI